MNRIIEEAIVKVTKFNDLKIGDIILYAHFEAKVTNIQPDVVIIQQFLNDPDSWMAIKKFEFYNVIIKVNKSHSNPMELKE